MAAIEVDDGENDGPDASATVVYISTEDVRAVDRYGTPVRKRAERCHSKHHPGADVVAVRPVPPRRCGVGEASPGADVALARPVPAQMWHWRRVRLKREVRFLFVACARCESLRDTIRE